MQHYYGNVTDQYGNAKSNASVLVQIGGVDAVIYSDNGVTPKANPTTANTVGTYDFYAANGEYVITSGGVSETVRLFDPADERISVMDSRFFVAGESDYTGRVQRALTYAVSQARATLELPAGVFSLGSLVSATTSGTNALTIRGAGVHSTVITGPSTNTTGLIKLTGSGRAAPVMLQDITIAPGCDGAGVGFEYACPEGGVQRKRIFQATNCHFGPEDNTLPYSFNTPLKVTGLYRPYFTNVVCWQGTGATTKQDAILNVDGCYFPDIGPGCYFNGSAAYGISSIADTAEAMKMDWPVVNGADRGLHFVRTGTEPLLNIAGHFNCINEGVYIDGAKYVKATTCLMYADNAGPDHVDFKLVNVRGAEIFANTYRGSHTGLRHVSLVPRVGGVVEDITIREKALHGSSDIAPFYVGPGARNVTVYLPMFVPSTDFASYPATLYERDATAVNVAVITGYGVSNLSNGLFGPQWSIDPSGGVVIGQVAVGKGRGNLSFDTGMYVLRYGSTQQILGKNGAISFEFTAAQLADITDLVNTTAKIKGTEVWDSTNKKKIRASGSAAADIWEYVDGSAVITPV